MTSLEELLETLTPSDVEEFQQDKDEDGQMDGFCHTLTEPGGFVKLCGGRRKSSSKPHTHDGKARVCTATGKPMCPVCRQIFLLEKLNGL